MDGPSGTKERDSPRSSSGLHRHSPSNASPLTNATVTDRKKSQQALLTLHKMSSPQHTHHKSHSRGLQEEIEMVRKQQSFKHAFDKANDVDGDVAARGGGNRVNGSRAGSAGSTAGSMVQLTTVDLLRFRVHGLLEGRPLQALMGLTTLYALFGDDLRLLSFPESSDEVFYILSSTAFFLFCIELLLSCFAKPGYFPTHQFRRENLTRQKFTRLLAVGSFFFWLDVVATLSLIFEIPWMYDSGRDSQSAGGDQGLQSARAGRASRVGARAGRIVRLVRMVRLARLAKLYGIWQRRRQREEERGDWRGSFTGGLNNSRPGFTMMGDSQLDLNGALLRDDSGPREGAAGGRVSSSLGGLLAPGASAGGRGGGGAAGGPGGAGGGAPPPPPHPSLGRGREGAPKESRVGAKMSDVTTRRVIVGVLLMLVAIPLLNLDSEDESALYGVDLLQGFALQAANASLALDGGGGGGGGNATAAGGGWAEGGLAFAVAEFANLTAGALYLAVNGTVYLRDDATLGRRRESELRYVTVSTVAGGAFHPFSTEAVVDQKAASQEEALLGLLLTCVVIVLLGFGSLYFVKDVQRLVIMPIEAMVELVKKIRDNPLGFDYRGDPAFEAGLETTLLLNTIHKIGGLMRVGFGEAGASIIARNLQLGVGAAGSGRGLNLLGSGYEIHSIFGFCDIRNFTDTTECLQEEVMLFVNRIATVLHGVVAQCAGAANKNIGDAFLLTWKVDPALGAARREALADQALYSFVRTVAEMSRHQTFFLNFSLEATHRLFTRMPGYKVRMGFGLHYGWAIEGAIGSHNKIDASYISPHVNMSEFLESSTKEYGVCLLMSGAFHALLSDEAKYYCRQVDAVQHRGFGAEPCGLFTYDLDAEVSFYEPPSAARRRANSTAMSPEAVEAMAARFARRFSASLTKHRDRVNMKEDGAPVLDQPTASGADPAMEQAGEEPPHRGTGSRLRLPPLRSRSRQEGGPGPGPDGGGGEDHHGAGLFKRRRGRARSTSGAVAPSTQDAAAAAAAKKGGGGGAGTTPGHGGKQLTAGSGGRGRGRSVREGSSDPLKMATPLFGMSPHTSQWGLVSPSAQPSPTNRAHQGKFGTDMNADYKEGNTRPPSGLFEQKKTLAQPNASQTTVKDALQPTAGSTSASKPSSGCRKLQLGTPLRRISARAPRRSQMNGIGSRTSFSTSSRKNDMEEDSLTDGSVDRSSALRRTYLRAGSAAAAAAGAEEEEGRGASPPPAAAAAAADPAAAPAPRPDDSPGSKRHKKARPEPRPPEGPAAGGGGRGGGGGADRPAKGGGAGAGGGGRPHHRRRSSEGTNASGLDCLLATAAMLASQDSGPPEESASGLAWRIKRQESVKAGRQLNAAIDREVEAHQKGKPGPTGSMHVTGAQNPALVRDDGRTIEPELVTELATVRERRKVRDLKTRKLLGISEAEHEAALEPRVRVAPYSRRVWAMDRDLARLQHKRTGEFVAAWARAFAAYAAGRWAEARPLLKAALRLSNDEDGPANFLLKVIADHGGVAPEGWAGFRVVS